MLKINKIYKIEYKNNTFIYYFSKKNNGLLKFYIKIKKGHLFFDKDVLIYNSYHIIKTNTIFNYNKNKIENFILNIIHNYISVSNQKRFRKIFKDYNEHRKHCATHFPY